MKDVPNAVGRMRSKDWIICKDESLTVQSDQPGTELRYILDRYAKGILGDQLDVAEAQFQDVTAFQDYADVMRTAKDAEHEFMKLPPDVRRLFKNDVANYLDTAHDPEKRNEMVRLGYLEADQAVDPGSDSGDPPQGGAPEDAVLPSGEG